MSNPRVRAVLKQILLQLILLSIVVIVVFPVLWMLSISIDSRNIDKPLELTLIPPGATLEAYRKVLVDPNPLLCRNPSAPETCMTFKSIALH